MNDIEIAHPWPVNPARAGMIRPSIIMSSSFSGKPRASGDDPRFDLLVPELVE